MFRRYSKLLLHTSAIVAAGWLCFQPLASTAVAQTLTPQQISQFEANPAAALAQYSNGGAELVSFIRDLMLTDPATLNGIIGLIPTASPAQQSAIGTGLGQAAQSLVRTNPAVANLIQQSLIACGSGIPQPGRRSPCENAVLAYAGVTGNSAITAAGGGGGAGAGAGTGPTGNGPATGGSNSGTGPQGTSPVTTTGFTIPGGSVSFGGGAGGGTTTTTVTTTTVAGGSASPF